LTCHSIASRINFLSGVQIDTFSSTTAAIELQPIRDIMETPCSPQAGYRDQPVHASAASKADDGSLSIGLRDTPSSNRISLLATPGRTHPRQVSAIPMTFAVEDGTAPTARVMRSGWQERLGKLVVHSFRVDGVPVLCRITQKRCDACYACSSIDMPNLHGLLFTSRHTTRWCASNSRKNVAATNDIQGPNHVAFASDKEDPSITNPDRDVCQARGHQGLMVYRSFPGCWNASGVPFRRIKE
jgi:hypothetical protein